MLAEWVDRGAEIVLTDGFGNYRIRTQSFNSVRNLVNEYNRIREIWRGPFKGIPFELTLQNRQGNAPDGKKRDYPMFTYTLKPRGGQLRSSSTNFRGLLESGNQAAAGLSLPAPRNLTPEDDAKDAIFNIDEGGQPEVKTAVVEGAPLSAPEGVLTPHTPDDAAAADVEDAVFRDVEPTPEQLRDLELNRDRDAMKRAWFAAVKDSHLDSNEARADFFARHVDGVTSLSEVVKLLRTEQFDVLLVKAQEEIAEQNKEAAAHAKLAAPQKLHPSITPEDLREFISCVRHLGLHRTRLYPFVSMIIGRHVSTREELQALDMRAVLNATGVRDDDGNWAYSEAKAADLLLRFRDWEVSEEGVRGVI